MKLSELYQQQMDQALLWAGLRRGKTPVVQEAFIERQQAFQGYGNSLAHCIAAFGDVEVEQVDVKALRLLAARFDTMSNPYHHGLNLIEELKASAASPPSSA